MAKEQRVHIPAVSRSLQRQVPLHAGPDHTLPQQDLRSAAGSHRHPDRGARSAQEELLDKVDGETSAELQARVEIARQRQLARQNKANAQLSVTEIETLCTPDAQGAALLQQAISRLNLSARAYHRVLKVARSIADLDDSRDIANMHIAEAVQYRRLNL